MMYFEHDVELLEKELQDDSGRLFLEDHDSLIVIRVNEGSNSREPIVHRSKGHADSLYSAFRLHGTQPLQEYLEVAWATKTYARKILMLAGLCELRGYETHVRRSRIARE